MWDTPGPTPPWTWWPGSVGHARPYTAMDVVARKRRMDGYNVLFPIGFDAFGLPTENYAIKNHIHPAKVTHDNIANFTKQLHMLGYSFDWDRVVDTTDPKYYKWTQWIFLQLYKHGLAYKTTMPVNWCTSCKCVLANEEVVEGVCERCGSPVIRKEKSQWMLKITEYAQRLIDDLDDLDFIERVKIQQKNWIGRSTGAEVTFKATTGDDIVVYTTRPDTLFGATYMVLSPEHELIRKWMPLLKNADDVQAYQREAASKSDLERTELNKEKTGVCLDGVKGINPVNGKEIPIFISDYVLATYGTGAIMAVPAHDGAIMAVPAHDDRDWEFAKKFGCEIIEVVSGGEDVQKAAFTAKDETGILVNSDFLNGMTVKEAIPAITKWLEEKGIGHAKVNYKLRDWVFSRQRYWGEPIPMVYCEKCGWQPLPEDQLPLLLPEVESYEPTDDGESPLSKMTDWVNTTCPCCGGPAKRETDTMPQWAGSSWYFLRYMDPHNDKALASKEALEYWSPVDWYNAPVGGFQLVFPAVYGSPQRQGSGQQGGPGVLVPGGLVQRRHGAHHPPPAVQPVLAQVPVRHRRGAHQGALSEAHQPRHDPGRGRREDVQVPGQRGQPQRRDRGLRRGHHAHLYHVHRRLREGRRLVGQRGEGLQALPGPCLEPGHRAGAHRGRVLPGERGGRPPGHQEGVRGHRGHEVQHRHRPTTSTPTAPAGAT